MHGTCCCDAALTFLGYYSLQRNAHDMLLRCSIDVAEVLAMTVLVSAYTVAATVPSRT